MKFTTLQTPRTVKLDVDSSTPECVAALGIAWAAGSGARWLLKLLVEWGALALWEADAGPLLRRGVGKDRVERFASLRSAFRPAELLASLCGLGGWFVPWRHPLYPTELEHLDAPPAGLFGRGDLQRLAQVLSAARITVVGTRRATPYGRAISEAFAERFAENGVVVLSGMALGVDGWAHKAALDAGGLTVGVLGHGLDTIYPRSHEGLGREVADRGILLSELPPGVGPTRWTFPLRNRLLAALGDAVLVTEAGEASGALQTAGWALALGRPVFAVPGHITAQSSRGCNRLIYDGATPALEACATVEDFLAMTRIERAERWPLRDVGSLRPACEVGRGGLVRSATGGPSLGAEPTVLKALSGAVLTIDELVSVTGVPLQEAVAAVSTLELRGSIVRAGPGRYARAP